MAKPAVDWKSLKEFMGRAEKIKTRAQWKAMLQEAMAMEEPTRSLAVEHIYIYSMES